MNGQVSQLRNVNKNISQKHLLMSLIVVVPAVQVVLSPTLSPIIYIIGIHCDKYWIVPLLCTEKKTHKSPLKSISFVSYYYYYY